MNCPNCGYDLESLETYDGIFQNHSCPNCDSELYLDYWEDCFEDYSDCWDCFSWEPIEPPDPFSK